MIAILVLTIMPSLVGPGGIGKTRLAQQAARGKLGDFLDGVWLVPLASLDNEADLVTAVAQAIDFTFSGAGSPQAQLLQYLRRKEMLLVLDNFEQLLTDGRIPLVTEILAQAPQVKLLVTSQERLNVQAESLLELNGLPYPSVTNDNEAADYPAIQLFADRARRLKPDCALDVTAVSHICQLVEGLPLALELAAAWIRVLPLAEIAAEIEQGLDFLTSPLRDAPDRHRSVRILFEGSWQISNVNEQQESFLSFFEKVIS
ncbi:MAG: hypothetical protein H6662_09485 [Ardenticatenaceae bacterium]|nr:hypothetical protein [Anaerolineales bacterium]MCB8921804.1 hypothetical protein [Ardenticatenaceae bacterium]